MSFTVVIPARFASTRLPGKPLLDIAGKPMIRRVWERASACAAARVVIATDDVRIREVAEGFGAEVCMTSPTHPSGTDRLQEAVASLGLPDDAIVVNVQGDEPLIPPVVIGQVASDLARETDCGMATLCEPIERVELFLDPNVVKLVRDARSRAIYFSRAPIPWPRDAFAADRSRLPEGFLPLRHIGIYAYRVGFLHRFTAWPVGVLEARESLEQLRALENGIGIHAAQACEPIPGGVDTAEDLARVNALLRGSGS